MLFGTPPLHSTQTIQQTKGKQTSKTQDIAEAVHQAALKVFKILSIPLVLPYYLLAIPIQTITSVLIGAVSSGKSIKKTMLFGLTFFTRPLASAIGYEPKGGAPYTERTEISKGLHVSRLPFKKDVDKIAEELKIKNQKDKPKINQDKFQENINLSSISQEMKTKLLQQLLNQQVKENIEGVIIDVTEPAETTYVLGLGKPATKDDWNKKGILYFNLPAKDMEALDVQMNLDLAELAHIARTNYAGALVHCAKGIGRSLTIGLTAHAIYGSNNHIDLAPAVSTAIKEIKSKRAYGLNASQELVVYKSKLRCYLTHLKAKLEKDLLSPVPTETITKIEEALKKNSNLKNLANEMVGNSSDHQNLKLFLKELEEAKSKVSTTSNIDDSLEDYLHLPSAMTP